MIAPDDRGGHERGLHDLRSLLGREGLAIALIAFAAFAGNGMLFPVLPLYLDHLGASGATVGIALALLGLGEGLFLAVFTFGSAAGYVALAFLPIVAAVLIIRFVLAALGAAVWPAG